MNKTININLGGLLFHVNDDAYQLLNDYLLSLKNHFSTEKGADEIMNDIEIRFAELFQKKILPTKSTINMADVQEAISAMGKPENFNYDENQTHQAKRSYVNNSTQKRFFRDPDERVIGGVCSGLAHYFGISVYVIRIFLLLLIFAGFSGVLIYFILWAVLPAARSTSEKLAMKGQAANIDNIQRQFNNEIHDVNNKYANKSAMDNVNDTFRNVFGVMGNIIKFLFKGFAILFLAFISIIGLVLFAFIVNNLFSSTPFLNFSDSGVQYIPSFFHINSIFDTPSQAWMARLGILFCIGIPVFLAIYHCIRLLVGAKSNSYITRTSLLFWLLGVLFSIISINTIFKIFKVKNSANQVLNLTNSNKTWHLKMNMENDSNLYSTYNDEVKVTFFNFIVNSEFTSDDNFMFAKPDIKVFKSETDSAYIIITKSANGTTKEIAANYTQKINFNAVVHDSLILIDNIFKISKAQKFRNQQVTVKIYLPANQKIFFNSNTKRYLNDVENLSNTWDFKMINHTWEMQTNGLKCIDKDFVEADEMASEKEIKESIEDLKNGEEVSMQINEDGVYINGKKVKDSLNLEGKIDEKDFKASKVDLEINENGIRANIKGRKEK